MAKALPKGASDKCCPLACPKLDKTVPEMLLT